MATIKAMAWLERLRVFLKKIKPKKPEIRPTKVYDIQREKKYFQLFGLQVATRGEHIPMQ